PFPPAPCPLPLAPCLCIWEEQLMIGSLTATFVSQLTDSLDWRLSGVEAWREGAVLLCWHGEIVLGAGFIRQVRQVRQVTRAAECWVPIVPEYGQSRMMTEFVRQLGLHPFHVPGYECPDERRVALSRLIPILQSGQSVFLAADGHRAPAHVLEQDPLWLAASANVPLLPIALAARPAFRLPIWDRKLVPLPRSRAAAVIAPAMRGNVTPEEVRAQLAHCAERAACLLQSGTKIK
ncbi:MAG: hypothetical protein ACPGWR_09225, partial [Ardenticatenaceae bacterium]